MLTLLNHKCKPPIQYYSVLIQYYHYLIQYPEGRCLALPVAVVGGMQHLGEEPLANGLAQRRAAAELR